MLPSSANVVANVGRSLAGRPTRMPITVNLEAQLPLATTKSCSTSSDSFSLAGSKPDAEGDDGPRCSLKPEFYHSETVVWIAESIGLVEYLNPEMAGREMVKFVDPILMNTPLKLKGLLQYTLDSFVRCHLIAASEEQTLAAARRKHANNEKSDLDHLNDFYCDWRDQTASKVTDSLRLFAIPKAELREYLNVDSKSSVELWTSISYQHLGLLLGLLHVLMLCVVVVVAVWGLVLHRTFVGLFFGGAVAAFFQIKAHGWDNACRRLTPMASILSRGAAVWANGVTQLGLAMLGWFYRGDELEAQVAKLAEGSSSLASSESGSSADLLVVMSCVVPSDEFRGAITGLLPPMAVRRADKLRDGGATTTKKSKNDDDDDDDDEAEQQPLGPCPRPYSKKALPFMESLVKPVTDSLLTLFEAIRSQPGTPRLVSRVDIPVGDTYPFYEGFQFKGEEEKTLPAVTVVSEANQRVCLTIVISHRAVEETMMGNVALALQNGMTSQAMDDFLQEYLSNKTSGVIRSYKSLDTSTVRVALPWISTSTAPPPLPPTVLTSLKPTLSVTLSTEIEIDGSVVAENAVAAVATPVNAAMQWLNG